jgi:hypothetical protein
MHPIVDRGCAGCTLCCSLLGVAELDKPPLVACTHCTVADGCRIYSQRPTECRQFHCGYLLHPALDKRWHPSRARLIVAFDEYPYAVAVHVDPASPDAWRQEPYFSQIQRWSWAAARARRQVVIWQGQRKIIMPPPPARPAARVAPAPPAGGD